MLTKPRLRSPEAEPGTFSCLRVFLTNVHSEGSGTHSSSSKNTFHRASGGRSHGVQSLFAWKRLERRVAALSPDVFGFNFQVVRPNTAERFGCSGLMLRSIRSYEEETTEPSCSTSACAGVVRDGVIATFSAHCSWPSSPSPPHYFPRLVAGRLGCDSSQTDAICWRKSSTSTKLNG